MKYVLISKNRVAEIIQDYDPTFPGIPIEDRYSSDFLAQCVAVDNDKEIQQNWVYENSAFSPPSEPESEDDETADDESAETEE